MRRVKHEYTNTDISVSELAANMLSTTYIKDSTSILRRFENVATALGSNEEHAKRLLSYLIKNWFMPSTPVLANIDESFVDQMEDYLDYKSVKTNRLTISCFLSETADTLDSIIEKSSEAKYLSTSGGGIANCWSYVRGETEKSPGPIPFIAVENKENLAFYQGRTRRGAKAVYMHYTHPSIEMFIAGRDPTGGDIELKFLTLHHCVTLDDRFFRLVAEDKEFDLVDPNDKSVKGSMNAREFWFKLLDLRKSLGEPFLMNLDTANRALPKVQKEKGLKVSMSNLCTETVLPTSPDRTAVCTILNPNIELFDDWQNDEYFISDLIEALDNVTQSFIDIADPKKVPHAINSAKAERALILGGAGFHSYLQRKGIPIESALAISAVKRIWSNMHSKAIEASKRLAKERGEPSDMAGSGMRNSHLTACPPTASVSNILNTSPGIDPWHSNTFTQRTQTGTHLIVNPHLLAVLERHGKNNKDVLDSIKAAEGSVAHLDFLDSYTKDVFKTADEIDMNWLVELAIARQPYIDQGQSLNIWVDSAPSIEYMHSIHWKAMTGGLKTMYYVRSKPTRKGESRVTREIKPSKDFVTNPEVCIACQ